jgi:predicted Holliday junction resolvase-like endonuclease
MDILIFLLTAFLISLFFLRREKIDLTKYIDKEVYDKHVFDTNVYTLSLKNKILERESERSSLNKQLSDLRIEFEKLHSKHTEELGKKKSNEVRLGQISENIVPFLKDFPYNPKSVVAIFRPVDYLVFAEDRVIFVEVKTGNAQESPKQKHIRCLIENKQVYYEVHRLDEKGYTIKRKED